MGIWSTRTHALLVFIGKGGVEGAVVVGDVLV